MNYHFYIRGLLLGWIVLLCGFWMDLTFCREEYNYIKKNHAVIFQKAWKTIFFNLVFITPVLYIFLLPIFIEIEEEFYFNIYKFLGLISIQNIGYHITHYIMHHYIYSIHRFHHLFDKVIFPSIAFAVSPFEFLFAYISPIIIGGILLRPSEVTFLCSVFTISFFNLVIHNQKWKEIKWFYYFVSPKDHIEHHEKRNKNYSAPILSFDKILF